MYKNEISPCTRDVFRMLFFQRAWPLAAWDPPAEYFWLISCVCKSITINMLSSQNLTYTLFSFFFFGKKAGQAGIRCFKALDGTWSKMEGHVVCDMTVTHAH